MKTTTLNRIKSFCPCAEGWKKLLKHLNKTDADDEPLEYKAILESNGLYDAVWALRCNKDCAMSMYAIAKAAHYIAHAAACSAACSVAHYVAHIAAYATDVIPEYIYDAARQDVREYFLDKPCTRENMTAYLTEQYIKIVS